MRLIFILLAISFHAFGQPNQAVKTQTYGGTWEYEKGKGPDGTWLVYPETDSTLLFYLDIQGGPPAYHSGSMYERTKIARGLATFASADGRCKLTMQFSGERLTIKAQEEASGCGLGAGIYVDGTLRRTSKKIPEYFETREGRKIYFRSMSPEDHNK